MCINDVLYIENILVNEREDDRMLLIDQRIEVMEEDIIGSDSIILLNFFVMIFDDEFLEEDDIRTIVFFENVLKLELRGRILKFIDAVNNYMDVVEIQREFGIIISRIRFLEGVNLVFLGKSI